VDLAALVDDMADALTAVDASRSTHKQFQPGIGPFGEADAVRAALAWLKDAKPQAYAAAATKRLPDLLIPGQWAVELKVVRPFGDNGLPAEHWSENVLHPYLGNTSSLGDCTKLLGSGLSERKAIIIFGFEHTPAQVPLETALSGFELLARELLSFRLSSRYEALRTGLVHPVHQQLRVYGYELLGKTEAAASPLPSAPSRT
jgi:hypothetical protein